MTALLALILVAAAFPNAAAFSNDDVSYLVVDLKTREVVKRDWPDADTPIPVGSLVKPFLALSASGPFPQVECHGAADRCWLAKGHGKLAFRDALANSCNAYFLHLARGVDAHSLEVVAAKFGIPAPPDEKPETRIGLGPAWRISPVALARAYCELASRAIEPRIADVLAGMKQAAESGTASAVGHGVMAKTGTAPCVAKRKHKGDGFTVILTPRVAILVRVHGVPGAEAAKSAAAILRQESR